MTKDPREEETPRPVGQQPKTVDIPKADQTAILIAELKQVVLLGQREVQQDLSILKDEGRRTNVRLTKMEERIETVEARQGRTSLRVRDVSKHDLDHEAEIAKVLIAKDEKIAKQDAKIVKLESESATKADMATLLDEAATVQTKAIVKAFSDAMETPTGKRLKGAIVPVLLIAIAYVGLRLNNAVTRLQERASQQPTVVQLAPVTVYADPDGGPPK